MSDDSCEKQEPQHLPPEIDNAQLAGIPAETNVKQPGIDQVYRYLVFGLSLPERTVRSTAAVLGGAINESAGLLVPRAFQDSKTYRTFVKQMLDVMANDVGGVKPLQAEGASENLAGEPIGDSDVENYVAQKTVGTFIDLAGMATLHVSPLTILAIVSDIAYGSQTYLNELADELKREGVIAQDSSISNAAQLLEAVGAATADTADALDRPPISVDGLRETIERTRANLQTIDPALLIPQSEIDSIWGEMQEMARQEDVDLFKVSSAMTMYTLDQVDTVTRGALSTIRVTGSLVDRHVIDHYRQGLSEINQRGIYTMVAESSQPYLEAVWFNFSGDRQTLTEDLISGKLIGQAWSGVSGWFGKKSAGESSE